MYPKALLKQYLSLNPRLMDIEIVLNSQLDWFYDQKGVEIGSDQYDFHCIHDA